MKVHLYCMRCFVELRWLDVYLSVDVCFSEDKAKELSQDKDEKPLTQESICNEEGCFTEDDRRDASEGLPAFFSLAALAEVAAMENVHR